MAIGNIGIGNIPTLATFDMFDCRAMPNPYWDESLRGGMEFVHREMVSYAQRETEVKPEVTGG